MLYTKNSEGEITPLDFTETSEKVLDAVVHIKSIGTRMGGQDVPQGNRELPDPFKKFLRTMVDTVFSGAQRTADTRW